jgi:uncharacterized membrane protein YcjF (UPF0283 family)
MADLLWKRLTIRWQPGQNQIPCLAHVIQLVVKSVIEVLDIEAKKKVAKKAFGSDDIAEFDAVVSIRAN